MRIAIFTVIGLLCGFVASYFATRRIWLGDLPPADWLSHIGELNAWATIGALVGFGGLAGGGVGYASQRGKKA